MSEIYKYCTKCKHLTIHVVTNSGLLCQALPCVYGRMRETQQAVLEDKENA